MIKQTNYVNQNPPSEDPVTSNKSPRFILNSEIDSMDSREYPIEKSDKLKKLETFFTILIGSLEPEERLILLNNLLNSDLFNEFNINQFFEENNITNDDFRSLTESFLLQFKIFKDFLLSD